MCGITGFFSSGGFIDSGLIETMTEAMEHRGPNDRGFLGVGRAGRIAHWKTLGGKKEDLKFGLGFRRLSILDLSTNGAQPMQTWDNRFWLGFNGQIYNYIELKDRLSDCVFRSESDTECLLYMLSKYGLGCLKELKGIFAFAFYDHSLSKLWLVRDHLGVKPLYYFSDRRGLFFASEIRPLLKALNTKPKLNTPLLGRYLMSNWIPDPDTLFEGIQKLEPGHYLEINADGQIENHSYWNFNIVPDDSISLNDWVANLDDTLNRVVIRQMRSHVPLGFFLSGGIDSSLLSVKALGAQKHRPATFTTGFNWSGSAQKDLDLEYSRLMAHQFPFEHTEILLEPSVVSMLPKVIECLEEPIADPAAICSYLICEQASKKFKVLISGQGGDELFGGYPVFQAGLVAHFLQHLPFSGLLRGAVPKLPYSIGSRQIQNIHRMKKIASASASNWPETFFVLRSALQFDQLQELLPKDVFQEQAPPFGRHLKIFEPAMKWDIFHQMLYLDSKTYLPSLNLAYSDKTSMAHSIELRVPYLDQEIVTLVERMPSRYKASLTQSKIVLKSLSRKYLPKSIIDRKKAGFGLPLRDWFLKDLQPMAQEVLSEERLKKQGLFNPQLPAKWLKEHQDKKADHCMKLYSLMTFQLWNEIFQVSV